MAKKVIAASATRTDAHFIALTILARMFRPLFRSQAEKRPSQARGYRFSVGGDIGLERDVRAVDTG
jgi:hypothetical protein